MLSQIHHRQQWMTILGLSVAFTQFQCAAEVAAQSTTATLVRVEEDWVAMVGEPDSPTSSPQILNVIAPTNSQDGVFGLIQLNHRSEPAFLEGGQQVQGWVGTTHAGSVSGSKSAILYRTADNIRYTVAMEKVSQGIRFELLNGRSRTWGRFCTTPVGITVATTNNSLAGYTTENSVTSSSVGLGAHRLSALYITATRLTYSDGTVVTDGTDRFVHRYQLSIEDVPVEMYEQNPEEYEVDITEQ